MLENKFGENSKTDIKSLSLNGMEKGEEKWFDVRRDITGEDRIILKKKLVEIRNAEIMIWRDFVIFASRMQLLGLTLEITEGDRDRIKKVELTNLEFDIDLHNNNLHAAVGMRSLGIEIEISSEFREQMKERLANILRTRDWWKFSQLALNMRILGLEPNIAAEDAEKMEDKISSYRNAGRWQNFVSQAACMRLLGLEIKVTPGDKEELKKTLAADRSEGNWWSFVYTASNMRLLSADEIKVGGPKGLEIIDHKSKPNLSAPTPKIPDQRNF